MPFYWKLTASSLLETNSCERPVDLCRRPESDRPGRGARPCNVGALPRPVQDPLAGRVRYAHGAFDKEHAQGLIIDRSGKKVRSANADIRDGRGQADARRNQ